MSELKKCPFCGEGEGEIDQVNTESYSVICEHCGASGPMAVTQEGAVRCWESRT